MPTVSERLAEVFSLIQRGRPTPAEHLLLELIQLAPAQDLLVSLAQYRSAIRYFFVPSQRDKLTRALEAVLPQGWEQVEQAQGTRLEIKGTRPNLSTQFRLQRTHNRC